MDVLKINRELAALDALEKRAKALVQPNQVLLREIEKKRAELMNVGQTPVGDQPPRK